MDNENFTGTRHILNTISQWPLKHAINAPLQGTDPIDLRTTWSNRDLYVAAYDALAESAVSGVSFASCNLIRALPQPLQLEKYPDGGSYDAAFPRHIERMPYSLPHGD